MAVMIPKFKKFVMPNALWNLIYGSPENPKAPPGVQPTFMPKVIPNVFPKAKVAPVFPPKVITSRFPKEECHDDSNT